MSAEFKKLRTRLGLTQAQAARVFGLSGATVVSNIETGFRKPNKLARSLVRVLESLSVHDARKLAAQLAKQGERL